MSQIGGSKQGKVTHFMNYQLYSDVIVLCNFPEEGLYAGDIGTVVEQHHVEGLETGYSVEFFDLLGNTVAVATLPGSYIKSASIGLVYLS